MAFVNLLKKSLVAAAAIMMLAVPAMAQRGGARVDVKINSIKIKDAVTPVYRESQEGSKGAHARWCKIELEYDTKARDEWINEVEVRWFVMIETDNTKRPSGLTQNVFYTDVTDGRHYSVVYIKPKFFERYMRSKRIEPNKINVYVEVWVDGQRVAREERKSAKTPDKWYTFGDRMTSFANELLSKSKTPFAPLDYDYYEHEKQN